MHRMHLYIPRDAKVIWTKNTKIFDVILRFEKQLIVLLKAEETCVVSQLHVINYGWEECAIRHFQSRDTAYLCGIFRQNGVKRVELYAAFAIEEWLDGAKLIDDKVSRSIITRENSVKMHAIDRACRGHKSRATSYLNFQIVVNFVSKSANLFLNLGYRWKSK